MIESFTYVTYLWFYTRFKSAPLLRLVWTLYLQAIPIQEKALHKERPMETRTALTFVIKERRHLLFFELFDLIDNPTIPTVHFGFMKTGQTGTLGPFPLGYKLERYLPFGSKEMNISKNLKFTILGLHMHWHLVCPGFKVSSYKANAMRRAASLSFYTFIQKLIVEIDPWALNCPIHTFKLFLDAHIIYSGSFIEIGLGFVCVFAI